MSLMDQEPYFSASSQERVSVVLSMKEKNVLVVGGGSVALRKVRKLLGAGANVTVVSPQVVSGIERMVQEARLLLCRRPYERVDLKGADLVISATDNREVNRQILQDASEERVWSSTVDDGDEGDFQFAAEATSGGVRLAVSSGGKCPGFAQYVRDSLLDRLGPEVGVALEVVSELRARFLSQGTQVGLKERYMSVVTPEFLDAIRRGKQGEVERLLVEAFGVDYTLGELGVQLPDGGENTS